MRMIKNFLPKVPRKAEFLHVDGKSDRLTRFLNNFGSLLGLLLAILLMTIGNPKFLGFANIQTLLIQMTALLIVSLGCTFVILMGSIDISFAAMANMISVIVALLIGKLGYFAFPISLLVGAFAGWVNGFIVVKGRIPSLVVTLGTTGLWGGLAYILSGGPPVEMYKDAHYFSWLTGETFRIPNQAFVALGLVTLLYIIQKYTWYGRCVNVIGAGEDVARLSAIRVERYKIYSFIISGFCTALGATVMAARVEYGSPLLANGYLLFTLAAILVGGTALSGGTGGVHRTLIGAAIIAVLRNGMNVIGVSANAQQVVLGIMLIVAVIVTFDRSKSPIIK